MCRNIKTLFNFEPPATDEETKAAALQYVRKVSGFHEPSQANAVAFNTAINDVTKATQKLLDALVTDVKPHDRTIEAARAHARALKRFGSRNH